METISKNDLLLVNSLSARTYMDNKLLSSANEQEKIHLKNIKHKLKELSIYFSEKYNTEYGPFETSVSTGNDIAIGGTNFKRIWSGIFKGAINKQYAAQISFVMDPKDICLNVGFYFGRASGHSKSKQERIVLEQQLNDLGISLAETISNNSLFNKKYDELFDYGFKTFSNGKEVSKDDWLKIIKVDTKESQIIAKIPPNDFGIIENSTIDLYVSQVIFLMSGVSIGILPSNKLIQPLTPEQRAKEAERRAQIGLNGELYILNEEKNKLKSLQLDTSKYPKHIAMESMSHGYDILSLDNNNNEIYIEVKTTTRLKKDPSSKSFFMSINEYNVYQNNLSKYKLFRVYDIEGSPDFEEVDLSLIKREPDGFICKY